MKQGALKVQNCKRFGSLKLTFLPSTESTSTAFRGRYLQWNNSVFPSKRRTALSQEQTTGLVGLRGTLDKHLTNWPRGKIDGFIVAWCPHSRLLKSAIYSLSCLLSTGIVYAGLTSAWARSLHRFARTVARCTVLQGFETMPKDWSRHRAEIQRLYITEKKTLKEVQRLLKGRHKFNAS